MVGIFAHLKVRVVIPKTWLNIVEESSLESIIIDFMRDMKNEYIIAQGHILQVGGVAAEVTIKREAYAWFRMLGEIEKHTPNPTRYEFFQLAGQNEIIRSVRVSIKLPILTPREWLIHFGEPVIKERVHHFLKEQFSNGVNPETLHFSIASIKTEVVLKPRGCIWFKLEDDLLLYPNEQDYFLNHYPDRQPPFVWNADLEINDDDDDVNDIDENIAAQHGELMNIADDGYESGPEQLNIHPNIVNMRTIDDVLISLRQQVQTPPPLKRSTDWPVEEFNSSYGPSKLSKKCIDDDIAWARATAQKTYQRFQQEYIPIKPNSEYVITFCNLKTNKTGKWLFPYLESMEIIDIDDIYVGANVEIR